MAKSRKACQNIDFSKREIKGKKKSRSEGENTQKEGISLSYNPAKCSNLKPLGSVACSCLVPKAGQHPQYVTFFFLQ